MYKTAESRCMATLTIVFFLFNFIVLFQAIEALANPSLTPCGYLRLILSSIGIVTVWIGMKWADAAMVKHENYR